MLVGEVAAGEVPERLKEHVAESDYAEKAPSAGRALSAEYGGGKSATCDVLAFVERRHVTRIAQ